MIALLPLPITPIRPASALLPPPPEPSQGTEPPANPAPLSQTELRAPSQTATGPASVVLPPTDRLTTSPALLKAVTGSAMTGSDLHMRGNIARVLLSDQSELPIAMRPDLDGANAEVHARALNAQVKWNADTLLEAIKPAVTDSAELAPQLRLDPIPRDPAPEPRLMLTL